MPRWRPTAALAKVEGDKATVWASTQNPFGAQREIAEAIGLPAQNVRVITPFVGGGFGGKTHNTQAIEAARLSKAVGKPVQVVWSRGEEFFYDTFRPAAIVKISSGIDGSGRDGALGLRCLLCRRARGEAILCRPQSSHDRPAFGLAGAGGVASRLPPAPGARPATTPTPLPASRRLTSWRRRRGWTRWSSASRT